MNDQREQIELMSQIADRGLKALKNAGVDHVKKLDMMMDLEYTHDVIPLDLEQLMAFGDGDFGHDIAGIYNNFNRETKQMDNCFLPRSAKPEAVEEFIDMTPSWSTTLRIYGMALRNPDLDGAGEKNAFEGLQEAANHLDNTYPDKVRELKQALTNLAYSIAKGKSFHDPDVQDSLQVARELTGMVNEDESENTR